MLNSFLSRVSKIAFNESKPNPQSNGAKFIYRNELRKKEQPRSKLRKLSSISEPLLMEKVDGGEESGKDRNYGGVIRVKVRMTKQEAARLLSKCKHGGVLEFEDVAEELGKIPVNRVCFEDQSPSNTRFCMDNEHVLETIHEQF